MCIGYREEFVILGIGLSCLSDGKELSFALNKLMAMILSGWNLRCYLFSLSASVSSPSEIRHFRYSVKVLIVPLALKGPYLMLLEWTRLYQLSWKNHAPLFYFNSDFSFDLRMLFQKNDGGRIDARNGRKEENQLCKQRWLVCMLKGCMKKTTCWDELVFCTVGLFTLCTDSCVQLFIYLYWRKLVRRNRWIWGLSSS